MLNLLKNPGRLIPSFTLIAAFAGAIGCASARITDSPSPAWSLRESPALQNPESACWDAGSQTLFVSNVAGNPTGKDGKGWISRYSASGVLLQAEWVSGLNAPKGMRSSGGTLWVTDIDRALAIEIASGRIIRTIAVPGSKFLNDLAIGPQGEVYVSDTVQSRIHVIRGDGKVRVLAAGKQLESPNGLLIDGENLIVAGWGVGTKADLSSQGPGHLYSISLKTGAQRLITPKALGNLDGLEKDPAGDYLVSDWVAGKVFRVSAKTGRAQETLSGFKGSADIAWIPEKHLVVVPRMAENELTAYELPLR